MLILNEIELNILPQHFHVLHKLTKQALKQSRIYKLNLEGRLKVTELYIKNKV